MRLSLRHASAALTLILAAACIDETTRPDYGIQTHSLYAFTNFVAGSDSIECGLFASLPMADSIQLPWTGTSRIQVNRKRRTATGIVSADTVVTAATIDLTRGSGDSIYAAIRAPLSIVFGGRKIGSKYDAFGTWRCDDRIPLASFAPGMASGTWALSANRPID